MKGLALVVLMGAIFLNACAPAATGVPPGTSAALPTAAGSPAALAVTLQPDEAPPAGAASEFTTDFSRHSVPYDEIFSGGPPKDGIPSIDDPKFETITYADLWLGDREPVILVRVGDDARAYPIQVLMWHEIVNDEVGGLPLTITFCPLCNTAIAFERQVGDRVLDFGTTGRLRYSNLIMYDRQTETWWQQADGLAIAGDLTGTQLAFYPAAIVAWSEFTQAYPEGKVLSRETGFVRDYGRNPYEGYDDVNSSPFLYQGPPTPGRLLPMARVLTVDFSGEAVAYPYDTLAELSVVNDTVGEREIVVLWQAGATSPLDEGTVAGGKRVGTAAAYSRDLDGQTLTFTFDGGSIRDEQTGSTWDALGRALSGPLEGETLDPVVAINHFWFSWAAFRPDTRIFEP
ncbi:MAG: DUF3179 domain-containing protein [Chloroflexota bacterium]